MSEKDLPHYAKEIMDRYNLSKEEIEQALKELDKIDSDMILNLTLSCGGNHYVYKEELIKIYPVFEIDWVLELDTNKRMSAVSDLLDEVYKSECEEKKNES